MHWDVFIKKINITKKQLETFHAVKEFDDYYHCLCTEEEIKALDKVKEITLSPSAPVAISDHKKAIDEKIIDGEKCWRHTFGQQMRDHKKKDEVDDEE